MLFCYSLLLLLLLSFAANGRALRTPFHNTNCRDGRVAIVHLFEWKWTDVAAECERFLGPMGYCGVQVSPPNEHVIVNGQPWWQRYQPVSYRLESRSGSRRQFVDMVERCNNAGVGIYVDAIVNHMAGVGSRGVGSGGSEFDADRLHFPGVPYTKEDFNGCGGCPACCCVNSWTDVAQVRNCRLLGLTDLNQRLPRVRQKIVDFLNDLIGIGVAGFRVDAAKHMWPEDLKAIVETTRELNTRWFPPGSRAFIVHEVIDLSQSGEVRAQEYTSSGMVTEFRYCIKVREVAGALWGIDGLHDPGWGMLDSQDAFVFVDNHDNQRGHGGGGNVVTFRDARKYKVAQAVTLGYSYGHPRVMSSYEFEGDGDGPPSDAEHRTKDVRINADGSCADGWVCEHRWQAIAGMASFRKAAGGAGVRRRHSDGNRVAFGRGDRGFLAVSNDGDWRRRFRTDMPAGRYCNVIKGCPNSSGCDGAPPVVVGDDGSVEATIDDWENPIFAIHVEARAGSGSCIGDGGGPPPPPPTSPPTWRRTVVLIQKFTSPGQHVFLRGGLGHERAAGCRSDPDFDPCSVGIRTRPLGASGHYAGYEAWRVGSTRLNWHGAQARQGEYRGQAAGGVPTAWTSDSANSPGHQALNRYGDHYWMLDAEMDCGHTDGGWFELKGYLPNGEGWEGSVRQSRCSGGRGGEAPYQSDNHHGLCGAVNVFRWNADDCVIDDF